MQARLVRAKALRRCSRFLSKDGLFGALQDFCGLFAHSKPTAWTYSSYVDGEIAFHRRVAVTVER